MEQKDVYVGSNTRNTCPRMNGRSVDLMAEEWDQEEAFMFTNEDSLFEGNH